MTEVTPPVACTLDPAQMPKRTDEIRALGRDGLEAESRCCAFLDFTIADEDGAAAVTIVAPEGGETAMHQLADVFAAGAD